MDCKCKNEIEHLESIFKSQKVALINENKLNSHHWKKKKDEFCFNRELHRNLLATFKKLAHRMDCRSSDEWRIHYNLSCNYTFGDFEELLLHH